MKRTRFSHLDAAGAARMVDVGGKERTQRSAVASCVVLAPARVIRAIRTQAVAKGDVLAVARVAGIMAAKRTPDIVPLCHPLPLTRVDVTPVVVEDGVTITAAAETTAQTGVEMEALTAVLAAALTVYDMTKGLDPAITIDHACLLEKDGGKSGHWRRPE